MFIPIAFTTQISDITSHGHSLGCSSTWLITSNGHSFGYPIIYMDTIHITSNDHYFGYPIIHKDTNHITSNDHSFNCPIIYKDTIYITSNDHSLGCPVIYTDTNHITRNNCSFDCPIIYMDTFHNAIFYIEVSTMCDICHPQQSCEGYVFTPICHSVHRGFMLQCMLEYHLWEQTPQTSTPRAFTPWSTPPEQAPPRPGTPHQTRHPPQTRHHPEQAPPRANTPRPDTPLTGRRLLLRTVHILLECILVYIEVSTMCDISNWGTEPWSLAFR